MFKKKKDWKKSDGIETSNTIALVNQKSAFKIKEAYKTTRTNIMFSLASVEGCKRVIVTSAVPGEGKTTSTLNIAKTFADTGAKVLVIDADLRKSKIHYYLELNNETGLSNVLGGFCKVDEAISESGQGFDCITAGPIPPNPAELLTSKTMADTLAYLSLKYDYIFIDTPPTTIVTDCTVISNQVNGVILVARQGYSNHDAVKKALDALNFVNAKILGFILNDAETHEGKYYNYKYKRDYGYGHDFGLGYGYGYGYGDTNRNMEVKGNQTTK